MQTIFNIVIFRILFQPLSALATALAVTSVLCFQMKYTINAVRAVTTDGYGGVPWSAENRLRERMMRLTREIDVTQAHLQALDKANEGLRASALPFFGQEIIDV